MGESFFLWNSLTKRIVVSDDQWRDVLYFDTEPAATEFITLHKFNPFDVKVKRMNTDEWAVRERDLLDSKVYIRPAWHNEAWYLERKEDIQTFDHVDTDDPSSITFTANPRDGKRNRLTKTTPGRFLTKFFNDILEPALIKEWAEKHKRTFVNPVDVLKWASTPEEIAMVYSMDAAFSSCMQDEVDSKWSKRIGHPTRAYGAGDLKLAYVAHEDKLISRALVWPKLDPQTGKLDPKSLVGRVYGDATKLILALRLAGIDSSSDSETYDSFLGARLLYLPVEHGINDWDPDTGTSKWIRSDEQPEHSDVVLPYIDGEYQGVKKCEDGFFRIVEKDSETQYLAYNEMAVISSRKACKSCHGWGGGAYVGGIINESSRLGITKLEFNSLCEDCRAKLAFQCQLSAIWYSLKHYTPVNIRSRTNYKVCREFAGTRLFKSDLSGEWFLNEQKIKSVFGSRNVSEYDLLDHPELFHWDETTQSLFVKSDIVTFESSGRINLTGTLNKIMNGRTEEVNTQFVEKVSNSLNPHHGTSLNDVLGLSE